MFKIIGVGGQLANGKDEISDRLAKVLNEDKDTKDYWKRHAFAKSVKEIFLRTFDKDRDWLEYWKRIDQNPPGFLKNVRQMLIDIGDGFRKMKPDVWIDLIFRDLDSNLIISDCRYVNEVRYIKEKGGINILVWREGYLNSLNSPSEQEYVPYILQLLKAQQYSSNDTRWMPLEGEIPSNLDIPFDLFIRNEGNLEELYQKVDNIIVPYIKSKI